MHLPGPETIRGRVDVRNVGPGTARYATVDGYLTMVCEWSREDEEVDRLLAMHVDDDNG